MKTLREQLPRSVSRRDLFVPARRHGQPDPELRLARAASTCRSPASNLDATASFADELLAKIAMCPASPTRASSRHSRAPTLNVDFNRTFAGHGRAHRAATRRRPCRTRLAGSTPDDADLLAQPDERRLLRGVRPDAAIRIDTLDDLKNVPINVPRQVDAIARRTRDIDARAARAPSSRTTISSRRSTSTRRRRAAISAASRRTSRRSSTTSRAELPQASTRRDARPGRRP